MRIAPGHTLAASFAVALAFGASLAAAAPGDALSACLAKCDRSKLSETNRETCRLDCEQDAATDPELIRSQIDRKRSPSTSPTNRPAPDLPPARPQTAGTGTPNLSGRAACKAQCAADRSLSADDRATCSLECDLVEDASGTGGRPSTPPDGTTGPVAQPTGSGPPNLGPGPTSFLAMCLQTCRKGPAKLNPTDHATCRLTCENTASVVDVALDAAPTGWFAAAPAVTVMTAPRPSVVATPTGTSPVASPPVGVSKPPVSTPKPPSSSPPPSQSCGAARDTCHSACEKVNTSCERSCNKGQKNETDRETCKLDCGENLGLCAADCVGEHASCVNRGGQR